MITSSDSVEPLNEGPQKRTLKDVCGAIPARYVLTILAFLGFVNVYCLRVNLNVAMVAMVNSSAISSSKNDNATDGCRLEGDGTSSDDKEGEFVWDEFKQNIALGSFYYGYVVTQIPGGRLAELIGPKWLYFGGIFGTSVLTLVTPVAANAGFGYLILVRVLEGLGEGVTFPAMHAMLARWMPKCERSILSTIIYSGAPIGTVLSTYITGVLCSSDFLGGWPSAFYVFGVIACVWCVFWALLIHQTPTDHPRISDKELKFILDNQGDEKATTKPPIPWKSIIRSVPVWALVITHVGQNWGWNTLLSELPTFMSRIMHYELKKSGFVSALPYLLQAMVGWFVSYGADRIRTSGKVRVSVIRKVCNSMAFVGPALCLLGVTFSGCNHTATVILLTFAVALNGFNYAGYAITHVDMAPDFAGTLMGITNCIANFPGFLAPMVVGALTNNNQTFYRWNLIFYIASATYVVTALIFVVFGSSELQPWGLSEKADTGDNDSVMGEAPTSKHTKRNEQPSTDRF